LLPQIFKEGGIGTKETLSNLALLYKFLYKEYCAYNKAKMIGHATMLNEFLDRTQVVVLGQAIGYSARARVYKAIPPRSPLAKKLAERATEP
jgi:RIO-like serine/threonine protein kinase